MGIYSVNEAAKELGISKQTLVRYEKKGIFPEAGRNRINRWREYTQEDIQKLKKILGRGFTLIELVMVIVIVGILAGLVIPRFESFYAIKLEGAVKKVVSDIRYVQQLAVARHDDYAISFNATNETYRGFRVLDNSAIQDPFTRQSLDPWVNFITNPQYKGIDISSVNFGGTQTLRFNWQGIPQNASGTDLSSDGSLQLQSQGASRNIYVTPNTGRVRIE